MTTNLVDGFVAHATANPDAPALFVNGTFLTYGELELSARKYAHTVQQVTEEGQPLVALLAARSEAAYAGVLGILLAGKGYVPLHPKFPLERLARMLELSQCTTLIVGDECSQILESLLPLLMVEQTRSIRRICSGVSLVMPATSYGSSYGRI